MARSKDELKAYAAALAKEKGLPDNLAQIGIAVMTGDKEALKDVPLDDLIAAVGPLADLAVGRQADYSRAMGEVKQQHKAAEDAYKGNLKWKTDARAEFDKAVADRAAALGKIAAYEEEYGSLDETVDIGKGKSVTATGDVVKTADLKALREEVRDQMASEFLQFQIEEGNLVEQHFARFKQPLNKAKLIEVVGKHAADPINPRNISLTDAYNELYGEKITQLDTEARAAELKAAKDEGRNEGRKEGRAAAMSTIGRSGAAVSEDSGAVFARIDAERKAGDKPVADLSDDELAAAFVADMEQFSRPDASTTQ